MLISGKLRGLVELQLARRGYAAMSARDLGQPHDFCQDKGYWDNTRESYWSL